MPAMKSLTQLMGDELKDLFSAENQLVTALPKMAKKAASETLKKAFTSHLRRRKDTSSGSKRSEKCSI